MPQLDQLSVCPRCAEPLGDGDRFCGACGADLTAATGGPRTATPTPDAPPAPPVPPRPPAPPAAPPAEHTRPADDGTDFALRPPAPAVPPRPTTPPAVPPAAAPAPEVASARPAGHGGDGDGDSDGDYLLPPPAPAPEHAHAPDPRLSASPDDAAPWGNEPRSDEPPAGVPDGTETRCVACGADAVDGGGSPGSGGNAPSCGHCGHVQPRERDHLERESAGVAAVSDRGLRHHRNEDSFALSTTALPDGSPAVVAVVCDGVSSATRPDEASIAAAESACSSLIDALPRGVEARQAMHDALIAAARSVDALAAQSRDPGENAPACTIVGALVSGDLLTVGWIGDSRAYWIPDDRSAPAARLTEDDSWAAQMVAAGLMGEAEAYADARAHAITGWLGADAHEIDPHTACFAPDRPGVVVVCTDGLWNYAESAEEMAAVVPTDARTRPLGCARRLVGHALDGGGHDNVTVAVVPFPAAPEGSGPNG